MRTTVNTNLFPAVSVSEDRQRRRKQPIAPALAKFAALLPVLPFPLLNVVNMRKKGITAAHTRICGRKGREYIGNGKRKQDEYNA